MGTECSIHKDFDIDESPLYFPNKQWTLYSGTRKYDGSKVTVFVHTKERGEKGGPNQGTDRAPKNLRILRHPSILKYHESFENSKGITIVTEPVCPLECVIETLDLTEIISGLFDILGALVFLHEKCFMSHNNVGVSSIYVGEQHGSWRLGGMEHVRKFSEITNEFLSSTRPYRDPKSVCPEEKANKVQLIADTGHSLDAYAFGMLVTDVLDSREATLGGPGRKFCERIQSHFLQENPKMRPSLSSLLPNEFFKNDFLEVLNFLNSLTVKSDVEKDNFFRSLPSRLRKIPAEVVAKRLLPQLLSRFVFAEPSAEKNIIPHLLMPLPADAEEENFSGLTPILPEDLFREKCVPILTKLWTLRDCHVRLFLLKHFGLFAKMFEKSSLEKFVLPQMLLGLRDSDDRIVAATFNALAVLVHILGGGVVVGGEKRKTFFEGRPKFDNSPFEVDNLRTRHLGATVDDKMNSIGLSNVSGVLRVHNDLHLPEETSPERRREEEKQKRKQDRERRRLELEKKRDEKRREKEQRKNDMPAVQRLSAITATPPAEEAGEEEPFESWDDFGSPRSEGSVGATSPETPNQSESPTDATWTNDSDFEDLDSTSTMNSTTVRKSSFGDSEQSNLDHSIPRTSSNKLALKSPKSTGNPLKLGRVKTAPAKPQVKHKSNQPRRALGEEFEIKQTAATSAELDFFADMEPDVTFDSFETAESVAASKYGSALAVSKNNLQMESGWSDEEW